MKTVQVCRSLTVEQAAKARNVSARLINMARELIRTGRADLVAAVERGDKPLHAVLKVAKPERYRLNAESVSRRLPSAGGWARKLELPPRWRWS